MFSFPHVGEAIDRSRFGSPDADRAALDALGGPRIARAADLLRGGQTGRHRTRERPVPRGSLERWSR